MNPMKTDDAGDSEDLQALFDTIAADAKPVAPPAAAADAAGDNDDLQALFDTIAATPAKPVAPPPPAAADASGDNDDLQALFDSVAVQSPPPVAAAAATPDHSDGSSDELAFNRLGQLARQLHESLRELGYDSLLEDASQQLPDARQRLTYIAQMTEQAASRVLNATDIAKPVLDELAPRSVDLSARWDKMFANQLSVDEFKQLAADSRAFFNQAPAKLQVCNEQLTDIMMAQDFQDLTGQVIKKVVDLANGLEEKMLKVLIDVMPAEKRSGASVAAAEGLMNGPVIDGAGRNDVVNNQSQVDDLLESLGF
jgi:chemotaxis protein CheZ